VKDIRYYLQGVYVESNGAMTRIVATDGHRLHIVQTENNERLVSPIVSFLMPSDLVKHCLKVKGPRQDKEPRIMLDYSETGKIEARLPDGSSIVASAIDGKFPDYLRIVRDVYALKPDNEGEPLAQVFNQSYVSDAADALAIYLEHRGSTPPAIGLRPRGSSVGILACGEFLALVMPMRGDLSPLPNPSFGEPLQAPEPLQAVA
jgi:DNA polymerase III sliding clamp (beta) subunit (PCNA family)